MLGLIAKRVGSACVVMLAVSVVTFVALRLVPGDPATLMLGQEATPEALEALRRGMGLDEPIAGQFLDWLAGVVSGDWGVSRVYGRPVLDVVASALPMTVLLAMAATAIALVVALALGVPSALAPGSAVDVVARTVMQVGAAIPSFWLAILLMLALAAGAGWFPVSGYTPFFTDPAGSLRSLALPAAALSAGECGMLIRAVRSSVMEALGQDYMLSARVKGLAPLRSVGVYALRGALVAPLTVAGIQFAKLVGGTVAVESVFALPGLGRLLLTAVEQRDLMLVQGVVLAVTALVVAVTLATDLAVMATNPEVRRQSTGEGR